MTDEDLKKIHYKLLCVKGTNVRMVNELFRYIYTLKSENDEDYTVVKNCDHCNKNVYSEYRKYCIWCGNQFDI